MKHIIKKQILALDIPSGADSWKTSDQFKELFNTDVLPRLERICDEMGLHDGITLKLDTLTIDTGGIESKNIGLTWPEKIEQGFREELKKYTAEKLSAAEKHALQTAEQTELEILMHFLEQGTLPWYVSDKDTTSPSTLLSKLLKEQPQTLVEKIKASKVKGSLGKRLVHQFTQAQVNQLLQHFKTPSSQIQINWLQKEIEKISTQTATAFKPTFLFVKAITSIDSTISNKSHSWYFDLLFEHFIDLNRSGHQAILNSLYKSLIDNQIRYKSKKSLEEKIKYSSALESLIKHFDKYENNTNDSLDKSRIQKQVNLTESVHSIDDKEIGQTEAIQSSDKVNGPEQISPENEAIRQHQPEQPGNPAHKDKNAHLPIEKDQDERVRQHLERIKKQQIAKLYDAKEQPSSQSEIKQAENKTESSVDRTNKNKEDKTSELDDITSIQLSPDQTKNSKETKDKSEEKNNSIKQDTGKERPESQPKASAEESYNRAILDQHEFTSKSPKPSEGLKTNQFKDSDGELNDKISHHTNQKSASKQGQFPESNHKSTIPQSKTLDTTSHASEAEITIARDQASQNQKSTSKQNQFPEPNHKPTSSQSKTLDTTSSAPEEEITTVRDQASQNQKSTSEQNQFPEPNHKSTSSQSKTLDTTSPAPEEEITTARDQASQNQKSTSKQNQFPESNHKPTSSQSKNLDTTSTAPEEEITTAKDQASQNQESESKNTSINPNTPHRLKYWQEEPEAISECYIANAGLVLFWPYLGHFFKDLGLIENGKFDTLKQQEEAALMLQYLLSEDPELDEHLLPLNKLLCGLKISEPIGRLLELSQADKEKCNNLLETAIKNWPALRATTLPGFQKSFLNRKGVLKRHENHWQLQIEKMPFDMLIEQLPWPIGIVRLSWMNKPIYVEW